MTPEEIRLCADAAERWPVGTPENVWLIGFGRTEVDHKTLHNKYAPEVRLQYG